MSEIAQNIAKIRAEIAAICQKINRNPEKILLLPVTKTKPVSAIISAFEAGCNAIGENRVQEVLEKVKELTVQNQAEKLSIHLIGNLQTNKVKQIVGVIDYLHSLDSLKLAEKLQKKLEEQNRKLPVLIEVNTSLENQKHGILPDNAPEFIKEVRNFPNLELNGLMTVAKQSENEGEIRACFRALRQILEEDNAKNPQFGAQFKELSMGMSADWKIAIEEGATIIRLGSTIFGNR
ncbi:MAG: YggS family pyridoxal phosphate-dependent enzyme [Cardiobacteriaceae bacterium]|nr:YggS family pyridoxal phosphate-dependent enzyme [Cardiobacteriaceae bacterium]